MGEKLRRSLYRGLALSLCGVAAGCAGSNGLLDMNQGAVDYRYANRNQGEDPARATQFDSEFVSRDPISARDDSVIRADDIIRINLKTLYTREFPESKLLGFFTGDFNLKKFQVESRGEIALVVNVTEGTPAVSSDATPQSVAGRVVFFSRDMREKNESNSSFIPVYGPIRWTGRPLTIDITMLEIDEEERSQTNTLLSTLADFGQAEGMSPNSLSLLNTLGKALVSNAAQDSIMMKYRAVLVPETDTARGVSLPVLREGDLVVLRRENGDEAVRWSELRYAHNLGILYSCVPNDTNYNLTREHVPACEKSENGRELVPQVNRNDTYLVMTVAKASLDGPPAATQSLDTFLQTYRNEITQASTGDDAALRQAANAAMRERHYISLKAEADTIRNYRQTIAVRRMAARKVVTAVQCNLAWRNEEQWDDKGERRTRYCGQNFKSNFLLEDGELANLLSMLELASQDPGATQILIDADTLTGREAVVPSAGASSTVPISDTPDGDAPVTTPARPVVVAANDWDQERIDRLQAARNTIIAGVAKQPDTAVQTDPIETQPVDTARAVVPAR